jgi:hypothetical protein
MTSRISITDMDDGGCDPPQQMQMLCRERRPHWRNDVLNPRLDESGDIEKPLHDDGLPGPRDRLSSPVQVEELPRFVEERRLPPVQEFRLLVRYPTCAEGDHPPLAIPNRDRDAAVKERIGRALRVVRLYGEARGDHGGEREAFVG